MIPVWAWWLAVAACVAFGAVLGGCATRGPYWVHVRDPLPDRGMIYVKVPCGNPNFGGCTHTDGPLAGLIEIKLGMSTSRIECTKTHELRHRAGDDHPEFDSSNGFDKFANDCGDGTMLAAGV